jgi:hypothetical protein
MKIQPLFHRAERPLRVALAVLSSALALVLLGAAWFQPVRPETGIQTHQRPAVVHACTHPRIQPWIVSSLAQMVEQAI